MQLGSININNNEHKQVLAVLKRLTEPGAIDEIGIGRIRDGFANRMFPGTSTQQNHAKYFAVLPRLYQKAAKRNLKSPADARAEIVRLERLLTQRLCEASPDAPGITGSDTIKSGYAGFVKYDPAYIYHSGMLTYGIVHYNSIEQGVYSVSKRLRAQPEVMKDDNNDEANNDDQQTNVRELWDAPAENYDFTQACSLTLTDTEKSFVRQKILTSPASRGSLLSYLLEHDELPKLDVFPGVDNAALPEPLQQLHRDAEIFSDFVYMLRLFYYYLYSKQSDQEVLSLFNNEADRFRQLAPNIKVVIASSGVEHQMTTKFCVDCAEAILANDIDSLAAIITRRERSIKGSRAKIGTEGYTKNGASRLDYRWSTVKTYLEELREEAQA